MSSLSRHHQAIGAFQAALAATQKTVNIQIDATALETLKQGEYKLCFAKKVGDAYNVVWQSYSEYLENDQFSWTPQFQVFGSNSFQVGVQVETSTHPVQIGLGQQVTVDSAGVFGSVSDNPDMNASDSILVIDNYGDLSLGVSQISNGVDGQLLTTPIYVTPTPDVKGQDLLTPKELVMVWFARDIETSTMIDVDLSQVVEIDLTSVNEATRLYKDGSWSDPG